MEYRMIIFLIILSVWFISCTTTPQRIVLQIPEEINATVSPSPEETEKKEDAEIKQNIIIADYVDPLATKDQDTGAGTDQKDPLILVTENNVNYTINPEKFTGGAVIYPYIPNYIYKVFAAPDNHVDIQLQQSEEITSPIACGDTYNFSIETAIAQKDGKDCVHVYVLALVPNKQTTLSVNTNKRTYQFKLISYKNLYMPVITFDYPLDTAQEKRKKEIEQQSQIRLSTSINNLYFTYEVIPNSINKPSWTPIMVFDDGVKTYISFPKGQIAYSPVLLLIEGNEYVLCNYHRTGNYYVVDQLFNKAVLLIDRKDTDSIVRIFRKEKI